MKTKLARIAALVLLASGAIAAEPPQPGTAELFPLDQVVRGLRCTAWTVFEGTTAEPVPVEILGRMTNRWGPGQDIILAELGGKAIRTGAAGGMSGSPVYCDGKLAGAISLRFSVFSPDAVAGITPIDLMLEIDELDRRQSAATHVASNAGPGDLAAEIWTASQTPPLPADSAVGVPIETPISISGAHPQAVELFNNYFRQSGFAPIQSGAVGGSSSGAKDIDSTLRPGEPIAAVLATGDVEMSGVGTVTYNDGKRVLGFGHPMFNLGPVEMPIASAEILTILASKFQPVKVANSGPIVGALRQDRHSGIMGVLGEQARMIPVDVTVRNLTAGEPSEKEFHYEVFQNQRWTPQLLLFMLYNSMFGLNDFADEVTYRVNTQIDVAGQPSIELRRWQALGQGPMPAPLAVAGWVAGHVRDVLGNPSENPKIERVRFTAELLPERRDATLEQVWVRERRVRPGQTVTGKLFVRPFRGEPFAKDFSLRVPENARGSVRLLVQDAASLNLTKRKAVPDRTSTTLTETVALLNQEYANDQLYLSFSVPSETAHLQDKTMPNLPPSVLRVMRGTASSLAVERNSRGPVANVAMDALVTGSDAVELEIIP